MIMIRRVMLWGALLIGASLEAQQYRWTLCVYIAGDNDLAEYAPLNISQLARAANSKDVALCVYLCRREGTRKIARKLRVVHNDIIDYGEDSHIDSGSADTFDYACSWAFSTFPSEKSMVICWDHGSGILNRHIPHRGICYDDTTGNYLTDRDLATVLKKVAEKRGSPIDILGFDACLMANAELSAALAPYVRYIIASEETIPGTGWEYTALGDALSKTGSDALSVSRAVLASYKSLYEHKMNDYTLSVVDADAMKAVADAVEKIGQMLTYALSVQYLNSVRLALNFRLLPPAVSYFEERDYADLMMVSRAIRAAIPSMRFTLNNTQSMYLKKNMTTALFALEAAISKAVVAEVHGSAYKNVAGISIYLPRYDMHASYPLTLWHLSYPSWANFIAHYRLSRSLMMHGIW